MTMTEDQRFQDIQTQAHTLAPQQGSARHEEVHKLGRNVKIRISR
jgi:BMFP domain-containing protein YqiC